MPTTFVTPNKNITHDPSWSYKPQESTKTIILKSSDLWARHIMGVTIQTQNGFNGQLNVGENQ